MKRQPPEPRPSIGTVQVTIRRTDGTIQFQSNVPIDHPNDAGRVIDQAVANIHEAMWWKALEPLTREHAA